MELTREGILFCPLTCPALRGGLLRITPLDALARDAETSSMVVSIEASFELTGTGWG